VLEDPRRWYFFLSSFRRDAGHAGAHLLARIVEAACEAPVAALDLLRGDFDYKRAWTDRADWVHEIVCPLRPRGHAAALLFAARWRAARSERIRRLRARLLGAGDRR
jgi:CelD/BcsL family acetyltransferase involved in cellulose biosynthesis